MCPGARVYNILRSQVLLQYEWGMHASTYEKDYFSFKVNGVAFAGRVKIFAREDSDTFTIVMYADEWSSNNEVRRIRGVHADELVDILNANIDGSNAWERIKEMYLEKSS